MACVGSSSDQEKTTEITAQTATSSSGFYTVVLLRDREDAEEAEVLLPSDEYRRLFDGEERVGIKTAAQLGKAARAAAEAELRDQGKLQPDRHLSRVVLVYKENPTFTDSEHKARARVRLNPVREELNAKTKLGVVELQNAQEYYVLVTAPAQRRVVPMQIAAAAPAPSAQVAEGIVIEIMALMPDVLPEVELFDGSESPYAVQTAALAIPKYPCLQNVPYMLMEGLTGHPNDHNTRFLAEEKLSEFLNWCPHGPGVMVGVSGIGKTRTIFEALANMHGLYFVADTHGKCGMLDFQDFYQTAGFERVRDINVHVHQGHEFHQLLRDMQLQNSDKAKFCVASILLARLLVFEALLRKYGDPCIGFRPDGMSTGDLHWGITDCMARIHEVTRRSVPESLLCFVDEAQVLLNEDWALSFPSSTQEDDGRPLFTEVVKSLSPFVIGPIMAGTGLGMRLALEALVSSVLKKYNPVPREWTEFPALDEAACRQYLELRLGAAAQNVKDLPAILHGRARFSALFTEQALQQPGTSLEDVLSACIQSWTREPNPAAEEDPKSLYKTLERATSALTKRPRDGGPVVDLLKAVAVRYSLTGQPQDILAAASDQIKEDDVFSLVEQGVCRLKKARTDRGAACFQVLVDEPPVATAACNFFHLETFE